MKLDSTQISAVEHACASRFSIVNGEGGEAGAQRTPAFTGPNPPRVRVRCEAWFGLLDLRTA